MNHQSVLPLPKDPSNQKLKDFLPEVESSLFSVSVRVYIQIYIFIYLFVSVQQGPISIRPVSQPLKDEGEDQKRRKRGSRKNDSCRHMGSNVVYNYICHSLPVLICSVLLCDETEKESQGQFIPPRRLARLEKVLSSSPTDKRNWGLTSWRPCRLRKSDSSSGPTSWTESCWTKVGSGWRGRESRRYEYNPIPF